MIKYILKLIVRRELNKIKAKDEFEFMDILYIKYNNGTRFKNIKKNQIKMNFVNTRRITYFNRVSKGLFNKSKRNIWNDKRVRTS